MGYLLYLIFRCDFDVMESLEEFGEVNTARDANLSTTGQLEIAACISFKF